MNYRYMRTLLFFDLPTLTSKQRKAYRDFVKLLIRNGFYRIQESVFVKMSINPQAAQATVKYIDSKKPSEGNIITLTVTEKQFLSMQILLGDIKTDVEVSDKRVLVL